MLSVGELFPVCSLQGVDQNNEFVSFEVEEDYQPLKHDWTVVYYYPKDFTFICPTEIAAMDRDWETHKFIILINSLQ